MMKFYYNTAPNPMKVALFLEEAGVEYEAVPVDTRKGDQHDPAYRAVNPNGKVPALVDGDVTVFDSNAILMYLAEKTGQFAGGSSPADRAELLSWMMFIASGLGPYSGQNVHFKAHAPEKIEYAMTRYAFEADRHYQILEDRLSDRDWLVGNNYSIVDMAFWGWARMAPFVLGEEGAAKFPKVAAHVAKISARPAAERAAAIKDRHAFKAEMDAETLKAMFPGTHGNAA